MPVPLLQLTEVRKSFGAVCALNGVSFELLAAEVHALVGENGAGKSTLIKIITGAHQPDSGVLEVAGERVTHLTPASAHRLGIACIYQQPALFADLSVAENIALRLERPNFFKRVRWPERRKRAGDLLERIGANISPEAEARQLSMPEQQLVEIACALGARARIVVMDEPTASLTEREQHLLFGVVDDLRKSGAGVIYISHRLDEVFAIADRVTVLRDGETVDTRPVREAGLKQSELIEMMVGREVAQTTKSAVSQVSKPASARDFSARSEVRAPAGCEAGDTAGLETCATAPPLSIRRLTCAATGVRDVSLDVYRGEIVGLAGLVGAGRTELARVLFGLTPADSGEIRLNGEVVTITSPREAIARGVAYVPEDRRRHGIILEMPIGANLSMASHTRIFPNGWLRSGAECRLAFESIQALDIRAPGPDASGGSLSGGNQQKVALGRWLASDPKVLILDEPTQGVDVGAKAELHKLIRNLATRGVAVLMISSDLPEVLAMSDRIAVMRGGTISAVLPRGAKAEDVMAAALGTTGMTKDQ